MRVLVVTNMYPSRERPWLGPFVRDQVEALRRRDDLEVELFAFGPGPRNLAGAAVNLRRGDKRRVAILPVGIDTARFRPIPRREARERLGLDPDRPYLLFPHDPVRPLKRYDRAVEAAGDTQLLTLGGVAPEEVPYWINAANAVLVPSAKEGFGLAVIEALACGVPALGTPTGIHPVALHGIE